MPPESNWYGATATLAASDDPFGCSIKRGQRNLARATQGDFDLDWRIQIIGHRHWRCGDLAERIVSQLLVQYGPDLVIIRGGAPGVDQFFSLRCEELGIVTEPHLTDWKGPESVAVSARNREMVQSGADLCIALHRTIETDKGTKDCVRQALAAGIPVYLIDDEARVYRAGASWRCAACVTEVGLRHFFAGLRSHVKVTSPRPITIISTATTTRSGSNISGSPCNGRSHPWRNYQSWPTLCFESRNHPVQYIRPETIMRTQTRGRVYQRRR
jgi:hypothetical protein